MKRNALTICGVSVALMLSAGAVQAGRGADNPAPLYQGEAAEEGGYLGGGYVYTGRPNDNRYVERARTEGSAEMAVMEVDDKSAGATKVGHTHNGRPMDSLHLHLVP